MDPQINTDEHTFDDGKGNLHIPGAGSFGMFVLIASLSMLFAASMVLYIVFRSRAGIADWRPPGLDHLPATLWASTVLLVSCSAAIHWALAGIRKDRAPQLMIGLLLTLALGFLFLAAQSYNWFEVWQKVSQAPPEVSHVSATVPQTPPAVFQVQQIVPPIQNRSKFMATFYILTGLHAAHVLGGLIPLIVVFIKAQRHIYSRNFHPGVRYCTIYWHFLDVAWLVIFVALLAGS